MCAQKRTISICCTLDKYLCSIKIEPNLSLLTFRNRGPHPRQLPSRSLDQPVLAHSDGGYPRPFTTTSAALYGSR